MKRLLVTFFISIATVTYAQVTFVFHDGSSVPASSAGDTFDGPDTDGSRTHLQSGITLTAEAFLAGVSANTNLNGAGDGFGVNGNGADTSTTRIDNGAGLESMVFSFDTAGTFDSIDLRYIEESSNEGLLIFDGGTTYQLTSVTASGSDVVTINESFTAGQSITLTLSGSAGAGENFALESFTVTAVPEPSSFAALAGLMMLGFAGSRRRMRAIAA